MDRSSLVTVATDGFRDYVELPDGRTLNLGSVSVLKLITSLVPSVSMCRRALDTFLQDGRAVIKGDIGQLEEILAPKRARWATLGKGLIPTLPRQGEGMMQEQANTAVASFEGLLSTFDSLYQAPTPEALTEFRRTAAEFIALVSSAASEDASEQTEEPKEASVEKEDGGIKLAASEVPLVNEGLVHLVVARVEAALQAVSSSSKKGSDVAKVDLHVISTRLDGIVKSASMGDPSLRTALLDLAGKADQVRSFFA